jgi:hypothetical protein
VVDNVAESIRDNVKDGANAGVERHF